MMISIHQPAYLPWLGYFEKIAKSDVFVFLDTVQFEKNSFINRNQIKTAKGRQWLTIPVLQSGHTESRLLHTKIDEKTYWRRKHLQAIAINYSKCPGYAEKFEKLSAAYPNTTDNLSDFCFSQLQFWLKEFSLNTKIIRAKDLSLTQEKSDLVLEICQKLQATEYYSGILGKNYLEESKFEQAGIKIIYQNYTTPTYPQRFGDFEPNLSCLDFWMNEAKLNF